MSGGLFRENDKGQMESATKDETHIANALDTLSEICKMTQADLENNPSTYERRASAEEILRHFREGDLVRDIKQNGITINISGAVPVRPKTTAGDKLTADTLDKARTSINTLIKTHSYSQQGGLDADDFITALLRDGIVFREADR